jgi:hypothetical protein
MTSRRSSGSMRAESAVEPTKSESITVTDDALRYLAVQRVRQPEGRRSVRAAAGAGRLADIAALIIVAIIGPAVEMIDGGGMDDAVYRHEQKNRLWNHDA